MEESKSKTSVLSKYFDNNVYLVAGVCSRCYLEADDDVTIIAVNRKFLEEVEIRQKLQFETKTKPLWSPPRSPHNLIEETFRDPWPLLVATIFLNKTSCKNARPFVEDFLADFESPVEVLRKKPSDLQKYFSKLGLFQKRAEQVWKMSYDFIYKNWKHPTELYGIGEYGADAYSIFILGDLNVEPKDRFLRIYRDWAKMKLKELRA